MQATTKMALSSATMMQGLLGTRELSVWATCRRTAWIAAWAVVIALALYFAAKYAAHYFLRYNETSFGPLWQNRIPAMMHISAGIIALFVPFWQFLSGYRRKRMRSHRFAGRVFLVAVVVAATTSIYIALAILEPAAAFALIVAAAVWLSAAALAYWSIRNGNVEMHKEWMIRTYVLTFAFVTARLLAEVAVMMEIPFDPLNRTWASWVVPLFVTEVILQLKRVRHRTTSKLTFQI